MQLGEGLMFCVRCEKEVPTVTELFHLKIKEEMVFKVLYSLHSILFQQMLFVISFLFKRWKVNYF